MDFLSREASKVLVASLHCVGRQCDTAVHVFVRYKQGRFWGSQSPGSFQNLISEKLL